MNDIDKAENKSADMSTGKESGKSKLVKQILKFGVVGGLSFLIDFAVYTIVIKVLKGDYAYLIGGVLGFSISLIFNYFASMAFVFERKDNFDRRKEFVIFLILSLIGMGLNTLLLWLYVDILCGKVHWIFNIHDAIYNFLQGINIRFFADVSEFVEIMAKIFATAIVMVYNFISRKMTLEKKE